MDNKTISFSDFKRRMKAWRLFGNYYGILPIIRGINEDDLYQGILNIYKVYQQKSDEGFHHLIEYEKLKHLIKNIKKQPYDNLTSSKIIIDEMFKYFFAKKSGSLDNLFLEKTPEHIFYINVILQSYPQAKVIEIVRDGRDVHASWKAISTTKWWFKTDTQSIINRWNKSIEAGNKFLENSRVYRVRYEDLRHNQQTELTNIFNFLELEYTADMLENVVLSFDINKTKNKGVGHYVNKGIVGNWKNSLSPEEISLWNELASKNLEKLGYIL